MYPTIPHPAAVGVGEGDGIVEEGGTGTVEEGGLGVDEGGGLTVVVGGRTVVVGAADGGYSVVHTVVFDVRVSRLVEVIVCVAVPPFSMLLQNSNASAVCPTKASSPHSETSGVPPIGARVEVRRCLASITAPFTLATRAAATMIDACSIFDILNGVRAHYASISAFHRGFFFNVRRKRSRCASNRAVGGPDTAEAH